MKILIDECVPAGLQAHLSALGHECQSVREVGLAGKKNGELLALAEVDGTFYPRLIETLNTNKT